jgi:positive regulator of sigma E activity
MFIEGLQGEEGEVVAVKGHKATVKIAANKSCEKCGLCTKISSTEMVLEAYVDKPVSTGDHVTLSIRPGIIISSATILYIFPLLSLVAGYFVGKFLFKSIVIGNMKELLPALTSFVFLFLAFIPIRFYDKKKRNDRRFQVVIKT